MNARVFSRHCGGTQKGKVTGNIRDYTRGWGRDCNLLVHKLNIRPRFIQLDSYKLNAVFVHGPKKRGGGVNNKARAIIIIAINGKQTHISVNPPPSQNPFYARVIARNRIKLSFLNAQNIKPH